MRMICLFYLVMIFSCQYKTQQNPTAYETNDLQQELIGKWGGSEGSPVCKITGDSFYSYSENKSYPYIIAGRDLIINRTTSVFTFKNISVDKDTLFFYMPEDTSNDVYGLVKAYRHK